MALDRKKTHILRVSPTFPVLGTRSLCQDETAKSSSNNDVDNSNNNHHWLETYFMPVTRPNGHQLSYLIHLKSYSFTSLTGKETEVQGHIAS